MGIICFILGIVIAALGGLGGTTAAGVLILLAGLMAIPVFALRAGTCGKSMAITFGVLGLILFIVGGIVAGYTGFIGAVLGAICTDYHDYESKYYVCPVPESDNTYCSSYGWIGLNHDSYTTYSSCSSYSRVGDQKCCTGMKAAGKTRCITSEEKDNCDKSKASYTGGIVGIIASIIGCATVCVALGNCCKGYYDPPDAVAGQVVVNVQPAVQPVVQAGAITPVTQEQLPGAVSK